MNSKNLLISVVVLAILHSCFFEPKKELEQYKPYSNPCTVWVTFENLPKTQYPPFEQYSYVADLYLVDTCKTFYK